MNSRFWSACKQNDTTYFKYTNYPGQWRRHSLFKCDQYDVEPWGVGFHGRRGIPILSEHFLFLADGAPVTDGALSFRELDVCHRLKPRILNQAFPAPRSAMLEKNPQKLLSIWSSYRSLNCVTFLCKKHGR